MLPDSETLLVLCEALAALEVGDFTVKVSGTYAFHRANRLRRRLCSD